MSGDLRLPRMPARRRRPSKAQPTSKVLWTGRRASRRAAARSCPMPILQLLRLPEGPPTRKTKTRTRSFSAAGGRGSECANPNYPIPGKAIFWHKIVFYTFSVYFAYLSFAYSTYSAYWCFTYSAYFTYWCLTHVACFAYFAYFAYSSYSAYFAF